MVPKSIQNQSKINEKSISDASLFSSLFFNRFFIIFSFLDEAPEPWKSLKTYWFFLTFSYFRQFRIRATCTSKFQSNLDPFWIKNRPKVLWTFAPRTPKAEDHAFGSILDGFWDPKSMFFLIGTHKWMSRFELPHRGPQKRKITVSGPFWYVFGTQNQ